MPKGRSRGIPMDTHPADGTRRLGTVVRFQAKGAASGIKQLEATGFKVASSRDFRVAEAVPNDFGGADVQYFERFGIAIVRNEGERLTAMLNRGFQQKNVLAARPERAYRALGIPSASFLKTSESGPPLEPDYLRGYRDAVNHLLDRLLTRERVDSAISPSVRFDESTVTWGLQAIKVPISTLSGAGIKVAILDTGFDDTHPDFRGRDITKKVFVSRSSPDDIIGHGTHCIGTACGPLKPERGPRYGIAHEAAIYAGKVLGDDGYGTDRSIIAGMDWAVQHGCEVISLSLGAATEVGDQPSDDYEHIGQVCLDSGSLVVAAAGNESDRPGLISPVGSPANAATILAVGAIDRSLKPATFSCGGLNPDQEVDLAASGVDILSTLPGGRYARWDGTSMATPHVAGIAALLAESDPKFRGWALWARLLQTVRPLSAPARDVGKGLVQAPAR